jgi:hypothetical protein
LAAEQTCQCVIAQIGQRSFTAISAWRGRRRAQLDAVSRSSRRDTETGQACRQCG